MKKWKPPPNCEKILTPNQLTFERETKDPGRGIHENHMLPIGNGRRRATIAKTAGKLQGMFANDFLLPKDLSG